MFEANLAAVKATIKTLNVTKRNLHTFLPFKASQHKLLELVTLEALSSSLF